MSHSPSWNSEEKRIDNTLRRGTSRDRQQHSMNNGGGGLPPGRNYRQGGGYQNRDGGYHNKDGGYKDRGSYDVRRQQQHHQRPHHTRMPDHDMAYQLAHHNPGVHFEQMRQPPPPLPDAGNMMGGPHRSWAGGPPPLYLNCQQSPVPQHQQQQRSTNNIIRNNKKDDSMSRKSPEVGFKLLEDSRDGDNVSYVAAGTAPVGSFRSGPSPIPKNASPVPMPLVTNFAGQVLTRASYQHEDKQFDRHSPHGEQKSHFGGQNSDGRLSRNGREKRDSTGPNRHSPGPYFTNNQLTEQQVMNQLAQISVLQHIQSRVLGGQDMHTALQRLMENKSLLDQLQQHCQQQPQGQIRDVRSPDQERHRTYPVNRPIHRSPGDESGMFAQRLSRNGDLASISSEEIVPALMKFLQQQSSGCSPVDQEDGKVLPMLNSGAWPVIGPRVDTDSSSHVSPSPPLVSPTKQNYSSVVARCSSRSSTSESVKDGPILYSTKAAASLSPVPQHEGSRFDALKPMGPPSGHQYKDQRGGSPVLPVSIAAAATAASNKPRNDNSLTFAKTHPPCPPPTTPVDVQGQFEVSKMDVLSEQIWHYHNSITQTEAMLTRKLHLRDMLYYAISPIFPMCGLYVVGSSLNGFGNNSSDMDLCLMITNKDLDQKTDAVVVLNMILTTLAKLDWVANQHLILAKVPILRIKFNSPWQDITVDLNANNSVAIKNTHLLCYYSSFDWRVRPLVSVVKEWAKKKGINDANRSSFTSYSLVLMVIHYLQCGADPAILPSLQVMYPKRFNARVDVRTLNVTQPLQHPSEEWHYQEKTSLGELFIGFLNYYANKFDYDRDAISVRQGRRVDRASLAVKRPHGTTGGPPNNSWRSQWRCICIEEPFTQSNTAHSIYDEMVFGAIKSAFRDAHEELEKNRDLHSLLDCKPISVSLPHNGAMVYAFDNSAAASTTASPSPTAEVVGSSSTNSLNTAMTRSSSSANSADGEEAEKVHSQSFDNSRRKSVSKRGGGSNHHHHQQQSRKSSSTGGVSQVAASPVVSC